MNVEGHTNLIVLTKLSLGLLFNSLTLFSISHIRNSLHLISEKLKST